MPFLSEDAPRTVRLDVERSDLRAGQVRLCRAIHKVAERRRLDLAQPMNGDRHFLPGALEIFDANTGPATVNRQLVKIVERLKAKLCCQIVFAKGILADAKPQSEKPLISRQ